MDLIVGSFIEKFKSTKELWPLTILIIMVIVFNIINPAFLSPMNLSNFFAYFPELGIIALAMTLLLISGEFDLSVGSFFGFGPVLLFILHNEAGVPIILAFLISILISGFIGFINGLMVTKVKISSFLTTIGMMLIVRGIALYITDGFPQSSLNTETSLRNILAGSFKIGNYTIYSSLIWFLILLFILHWVLKKTRFGNWIFATGGNARAARARGINTDRVKIILFILTAVFASLAGTMDAFRIANATPVAGNGYELEVIAMVVIGGTSLYGGSGTIIGTLIGSILLRAMRNGIIIMGVPGLAYNIFVGVVILIMMSIHSLMENNTGGELL
ncbi:MAG: ABC transporter permease [Halanaerobiales bacterium]